MFEAIYIVQYVTKGTFDSYLWQIQEQKQKFISQIWSHTVEFCSSANLDDTVLQYADIKTASIGDTKIKEEMELDNTVKKLQLEEQSYLSEQQLMKRALEETPKEIERLERQYTAISEDLSCCKENRTADFRITLDGRFYDKRAGARATIVVL